MIDNKVPVDSKKKTPPFLILFRIILFIYISPVLIGAVILVFSSIISLFSENSETASWAWLPLVGALVLLMTFMGLTCLIIVSFIKQKEVYQLYSIGFIGLSILHLVCVLYLENLTKTLICWLPSLVLLILSIIPLLLLAAPSIRKYYGVNEKGCETKKKGHKKRVIKRKDMKVD